MPTGRTRQSAEKPVDRQALSTHPLGSVAARPIFDDVYGLSPEWSMLDGTPMWN